MVIIIGRHTNRRIRNLPVTVTDVVHIVVAEQKQRMPVRAEIVKNNLAVVMAMNPGDEDGVLICPECPVTLNAVDIDPVGT